MSIETMKQALEALELHGQQYPHMVKGYCVDAIEALRAAILQAEKDTSWRDAAIRLGEELSSVGPDGYYDMDAGQWLDWAIKQEPRGKTSLPQRSWQGLTDKEHEQIAIDCGCASADWVFYGATVERKLREKNT